MTKTKRFAILGSTRGSSMQPILEALVEGRLDCELAVVASNKRHSGILDKAEVAHQNILYLPLKGRTREAYDKCMSHELEAREVDFIVLIGFMRILSPFFVQRWEGRIVNIHPSLLPKYGGMMDLDIHNAVLSNGDSETGCSLHIVNEEVDGGPVLIQKKCNVDGCASAEVLKDRVQKMEGEAFVELLSSPSSYLSLS